MSNQNELVIKLLAQSVRLKLVVNGDLAFNIFNGHAARAV